MCVFEYVYFLFLHARKRAHPDPPPTHHLLHLSCITHQLCLCARENETNKDRTNGRAFKSVNEETLFCP